MQSNTKDILPSDQNNKGGDYENTNLVAPKPPVSLVALRCPERKLGHG
jgi:hypothetical protein